MNKISSGVPLITAKNVKSGYIDYTIDEYISEEEYWDRQQRGTSRLGDILFTTEAPLGNAAIADIEKFNIRLSEIAKNIEEIAAVRASKDIEKLASKVDSKASARNVGKLSEAIGNTVNEQNMSDIQNALVEKGLSKKDAKRVAENMTKAIRGEQLTEKEIAEMKGNETVKAVVSELLDNPDSAINERTKILALARMGIGYSTTSQEATEQEKIASASENTSEEINAENKAYEVSEDGKTYRISTGEEIKINKIDSITLSDLTMMKRLIQVTCNSARMQKDCSTRMLLIWD